MRPRPIGTAVLVGALLTVAATTRAQDRLADLIGKTVASVRVVVEGRPDPPPQLVELIDVKPGAPFRIEDVRTSITRLDRTGRFENVLVDGSETPAGLEIVFNLVPRHPINRLAFSGDLVLPASELERFVRDRFGTRLSTVRSDLVEEAVTGHLADEGYFGAKVTAAAVPDHETESAVLEVGIISGPRATIGQVTIDTMPPFSAAEVIARTAARTGEPYRERALRAAMRGIRDDLRASGHYEAFATHEPTPPPQPDTTIVNLAIRVEPGPRVLLRWAGDGKPAGAEDELVPIRREGSADEDLLDDSGRRIRDAFWRDGYWKADVRYAREPDDAANLLVITFTTTRGPRYRLDRVEISGNERVPSAAIAAAIALKSGQVFREADVRTGLARVTALYLERGFHDVKVEPAYGAAPDRRPAEGRVLVTVTIVEGPEARIADVEIRGAGELARRDLPAIMVSARGAPFVAASLALDQANLLAYYRDRGFRDAAVRVEPVFDPDRRAARLVVTITEGAQIFVAGLQVVGNRRLSSEFILDQMTLKAGQPFGQAALDESFRNLRELDAFRRVDILEEPRLTGETSVHLVVLVEESRSTTVGFGGGLIAAKQARAVDTVGGVEDRLEFSPRGFVEFGLRSLGGRNRGIDFFGRVALRPQNAPLDPSRDGKGIGFSEYRVTSTFRERRAFRTQTDLLVGFTSEQGIRTTYSFVRQAASAEALRRLGGGVSVSFRYALDFTELFDERFAPGDPEQPLIDRLFPQVRLSLFSTGVSWDRRDDPLSPTRGTFVSGDLEGASRTFGSEVGYVKAFVQGSAFRSVTQSESVTLAGRVQLGVAHGFERSVLTVDDTGQPVVEIISDLPASQRFYAGGATTVRGFEVDRLGVPGILNSTSGLSNGGNGMIVLNLEVRTVPGRLFGRPFGIVGFMDGGNVFEKAAHINAGQFRGAVGFGLRYDSPLGPLRLDFGFKLDRHILAGRREAGWAWHLNLGEVF